MGIGNGSGDHAEHGAEEADEGGIVAERAQEQEPALERLAPLAQALLFGPPVDVLLQRFFEGTADSHDLAHGLHLRPKIFVSARKFLELPLGYFHYDVIQRRLEAGGSFARNVVGNFIQRITYGELGGNFCNRESGRLRRECRRARDPRIHLNHNHSPA